MERAEIRVRVSIGSSPPPRPGLARQPWTWDDVLAAEPPQRERPGQFVARHGYDEAPGDDARVGHATLVRARADGPSFLIDVEERVSVERRVLARAIRAERALGRGLERGAEASARVVRGGSRAVAGAVGGRGGRAVETGGRVAAGGVAWAAAALRDGLRALVEAPDRLVAGAGSAEAHLRGRQERRRLLRGLLDPHSLSREGKAAALFLAGTGLALVLLAITVAVALLRPQWAETWTDVLSAFLLALASTLFLPTFPELRLQYLRADIGLPGAIATLVLGMAVGAWLVLFLGDAIHRGLRRSLRPGSRLSRLLDRAEAFASRHGFLTAFLLLAVPLGPDTPVFYTLATVRTPTASYMAGVVAGLTVRFWLWSFARPGGLLPG